MEYLKCVRCGLEIRPRPARAQIENCPRCLARSATMSPMVRTAAPLADRGVAAAARRAGTSRRASQGVLANAIREMRSQGRARPAR
jgi:hypothetical protein